MLFSTVTSLLASYLAAFTHDRGTPTVDHVQSAPLQFELRHAHAVSPDARVLFHDIHKSDINAYSTLSGDPTTYSLQSRRVKRHRPRSLEEFHRARVRSMRFQENESVEWDEDEVEGPDVNSRETLLLLAKMTNNAYLSPGEDGWYDLGGQWNVVSTLYSLGCFYAQFDEFLEHPLFVVISPGYSTEMDGRGIEPP